MERESQTATERPRELSQAPTPRRGNTNQGERPNDKRRKEISIRQTSNEIRTWKKEALKRSSTREITSSNKNNITTSLAKAERTEEPKLG